MSGVDVALKLRKRTFEITGDLVVLVAKRPTLAEVPRRATGRHARIMIDNSWNQKCREPRRIEFSARFLNITPYPGRANQID